MNQRITLMVQDTVISVQIMPGKNSERIGNDVVDSFRIHFIVGLIVEIVRFGISSPSVFVVFERFVGFFEVKAQVTGTP